MLDRLFTPSRWKKRLLLLLLLSGVAAGIFSAAASKPSMLRNAEEISRSVDPSIQEISRRIDSEMEAYSGSKELERARAADPLQVCRRLSLALVGNGLSLEEVRAIERIPPAEQIDWWLEYLLQDRRSVDNLAERWTRATVGTNQGPFLLFRRRMYVHWLADQLEKNVPYDVIVRQLLTAKGSWTDSPQVNFLTATMDEGDDKQPDAIRLAGRTSRAFLAQRIDCLQCHKDYLGNVQFPEAIATDEVLRDETLQPTVACREGEQQDFHQLASFFAGTRMDNPFIGLRNTPKDYSYKYLNETEETVVKPQVPYLPELLPESGSTRERLATWVTHKQNKAFARATVNRMWAILFGKPWMDTIDNVPYLGPFPPGFELLASDFAEHDYDLRRLLRVIASLKAFRMDSKLEEEEPTLAHEQAWAVFPLTQLRPEQVAASIHQASRIKTIDEDSSIISKLELFGGVNDFTKEYGDRGDDEFSSNAITIPQRLLVMNGKFTRERIEENPIMNASTRIANLTSDNLAALDSIYLAVLNRPPSDEERGAFLAKLGSVAGGDRRRMIEDIYWMLLNSTEFLWNH